MRGRKEQLLPKARKNDLVVRQIPGELLVYDLKRHKAFCLNETAATIWKSCNGNRTVADLAAELEKDRHLPIDEQVIWLALDQLEKSYLLQTKAIRPLGQPAISRRSLLRTGIVTAVTLPLVTMITAPVAAQAGSPITSAVCNTRSPKNPGGCGLSPCIGLPGKTCQTRNPSQCECK